MQGSNGMSSSLPGVVPMLLPKPQIYGSGAMPARKGKWSEEEEKLTKKLIKAFNEGLLQIPIGTTLRTFLADKLFCNPMRITKKFAGSSCIGKQSFVPCESTPENNIKISDVQAELNDLQERFIEKLFSEKSSSNGAMPPPSYANPDMTFSGVGFDPNIPSMDMSTANMNLHNINMANPYFSTSFNSQARAHMGMLGLQHLGDNGSVSSPGGTTFHPQYGYIPLTSLPPNTLPPGGMYPPLDSSMLGYGMTEMQIQMQLAGTAASSNTGAINNAIAIANGNANATKTNNATNISSTTAFHPYSSSSLAGSAGSTGSKLSDQDPAVRKKRESSEDGSTESRENSKDSSGEENVSQSNSSISSQRSPRGSVQSGTSSRTDREQSITSIHNSGSDPEKEEFVHYSANASRQRSPSSSSSSGDNNVKSENIVKNELLPSQQVPPQYHQQMHYQQQQYNQIMQMHELQRMRYQQMLMNSIPGNLGNMNMNDSMYRELPYSLSQAMMSTNYDHNTTSNTKGKCRKKRTANDISDNEGGIFLDSMNQIKHYYNNNDRLARSDQLHDQDAMQQLQQADNQQADEMNAAGRRPNMMNTVSRGHLANGADLLMNFFKSVTNNDSPLLNTTDVEKVTAEEDGTIATMTKSPGLSSGDITVAPLDSKTSASPSTLMTERAAPKRSPKHADRFPRRKKGAVQKETSEEVNEETGSFCSGRGDDENSEDSDPPSSSGYNQDGQASVNSTDSGRSSSSEKE